MKRYLWGFVTGAVVGGILDLIAIKKHFGRLW